MTSLLLHNIRSTHNVGSLLRTADGFGVDEVIFSGYTPYPELVDDDRLPHIIRRLSLAINKTALGAERQLALSRHESPNQALALARQRQQRIIGLEQADRSQPLAGYQAPDDWLLIVGEEVAGMDAALLADCDDILEIAMHGHKESFNVSIAGALALYELLGRA